MTDASRLTVSLCALAVLTLPVGTQGQQQIRLGSEFRVNDWFLGDQIRPAVAADADGDFIVVWQGYQHLDGGDGFDVFVRRFSSAGVPVASELFVNSYITSWQTFADVAADADGDFVVVWVSYRQDGPYGYGIFGQRFSSAGSSVASEFQVNTFTIHYQHDPSVALDADGDFVVAWESTVLDGSDYGVFAQRFSSAGARVASEFQVNTSTEGSQRSPAVASEADGDFVVAWRSYLGVYARRFSSAGASLASEMQINSVTFYAGLPAVAADADGDFVVAWRSLYRNFYQPPGSYDLLARRFSSAGMSLAVELRVNTFTLPYWRAPPALAADANGDIVLAWESFPQDGSLNGIFARRISSAGALLASEFQVNSRTTNDQYSPAAVTGAAGGFVVVWSSSRQDSSGWGIFGQRFTIPTATATTTLTPTVTPTATPTGTNTPTVTPSALYQIPTLSGAAMATLALILLTLCLALLLRREDGRR